MNGTQTDTLNPKKLRILQVNLNKSETAHLDMYNRALAKDFDIILIQEPHVIPKFLHIRAPTRFLGVYPTDRVKNPEDPVRSAIWVNSEIPTGTWKVLQVPGNNDLTAIQLKGEYGRLTIVNIYNDNTHTKNLKAVKNFLTENANEIGNGENEIGNGENDHMLWCGDFNCHSLIWDRVEDERLCTPVLTQRADQLLKLVADHDMQMSLPRGIPTLLHKAWKKEYRVDNVWSSKHLADRIDQCNVDHNHDYAGTDHYSIVTIIDLPQERQPPKLSQNFRVTDWDMFRKDLQKRLEEIPDPTLIYDADTLHNAVNSLTNSLQGSIEAVVKLNKPCPHSKRWWNSDLEKLKKRLNKLRRTKFQFRALPDHHSHHNFRVCERDYAEEIKKAKKQHWEDFLEEASTDDMWTANKYLKTPVGDGRTRVPTLEVKNHLDRPSQASTNDEKANALAKSFFPPKPVQSSVPADFVYPQPLPLPPRITEDQIERQVKRLAPYKAHGPDGIPNVVLQKTVDIIMPFLLYIFRAILRLEIYPEQWKESTTVVLRKPGKSNYSLPKAYRPIALVKTMPKILAGIAAEDIARYLELEHLLPDTHFGGRAGMKTTDAVHVLEDKIRAAWRDKKVASVLFLDIEGAFPNAVTDRLIHNLRKRKIPEKYVKLVRNMLENRKTRLRFDDFISELIAICNGIGQGDPLSMILYIIYNSDLLEMILAQPVDSLGYVDDGLLVAVAKDLDRTTSMIKSAMESEGGGFDWAHDHNSRYEIDKLAIMHCTPMPLKGREYPALELRNQVIRRAEVYKYLGIHVDQHLNWKVQVKKTTEKGKAWVLQYRRLTKIAKGISPRLMRQLFIGAGLPKITYGAEVWYIPPHMPAGKKRRKGSVQALKELGKIQRIAVLAIAGALKTTPNDALNAQVGILPMELTLKKLCQRSILRLSSLPNTNPAAYLIQDAY